MVASLLARAQGGDGDAFGALVAPYRTELHRHCYRMLGSLTDADDVVQDTILAAWRSIGGFACECRIFDQSDELPLSASPSER